MSKKTTLILLLIISVVLLVLSFIYFIVVNNQQENNSPYYKTSGVQYNEITVITQKKQWTNLNLENPTELLANNKISESFTAQTDNLGIIAIPFDAHNRSVDDQIVFRIKEIGSKNWYFQSTYNADQFQTDIPFPFGFPIIKNSRNFSYTFEIESLEGTPDNSVSLSKTNTYFFTKYKFSKAELLKNPKELAYFLLAKTSEQLQLLTPSEVVSILFFFLSPFIMYWVVVFFEKKIGLGIRKKILKKINRVFWYGQKIWRHLALIKKIRIFYSLDRGKKIKLFSLVISFGFYTSLAYHYIRGSYLHKVFPLNSFLPGGFFFDFFSVYDQWYRFQFKEVGLTYFPGSFLSIDIIRVLFGTSIYYAAYSYVALFTIFMFLLTYKYVKTNSKLESIQHAFIISLMSYPFLFAFQTGNFEITTFASISLFFIFYKRNRLLSISFLAYAISMKFFPVIFIVLLFLEKRYKDILVTIFFVIIFTLLPLAIFDGGFNKGIGNYLIILMQNQKNYTDFMIMSGVGNHFGHSLLNGLRTLFPNLIPSMVSIMLLYEIFAVVVFLAVVAFLNFLEKTFWKRIACLVMLMNILPFTSQDYKLLYIFTPVFFFINYSKKEKYDLIYLILFSLLLIPKDYVYFNNYPMATLNVIANPIIMLAILLLIISSGIKSNQRQIKNIFNTNKLLRKVIGSL